MGMLWTSRKGSVVSVEWMGKAWGENRRLETNKHGHIYVNPGYKGFQSGLIWLLMVHNLEKRTMDGSVRVHMDLTIDKARDIDSLIKPVLDCIEQAHVIRNDNQICRLLVTKMKKAKRKDEDKIALRIEEIV